MVKMFPTCLDVTLERLFVLEKLPPLSDSLFRSQNMKFYQAELRFLRMFIWCNPDFDAKLHDDLDFIATSVAQLFKTNETNLFVFEDAEYSSLSRLIAGRRDKCHAEARKYRYLNNLVSSCSLKAVSSTCNETLEFLDSVHVNLNDLLNSVLRDKSEIEILEKLVFLLRNLVYYTPLGAENYDDANPKTNLIKKFLLFFSLRDSDANPKTNLIFQFNVHQWAHQAACLSLLRWITGTQDERIRRLHDDLQQRVNPCNPDFIKLCFRVIKAPKMKCEDRLLFGEFVSRFVDFFLENLILILNDDFPMVREGLILIITFLADPPAITMIHSELMPFVREQIHYVLDLASDNMCFFSETNMELDLSRGKTILDDFLKSIDEVKGDIINLYVHIPPSSLSNFPRINRLGYFECLLAYLEYLKQTMNNNSKLVPFLKHQVFSIHQELLPLKLFLQNNWTMQNEHNELKDIWEQLMSLLYHTDFVIKSSFFIDDPIWYNLTCLSFLVRKIKDKVSKIDFETQTNGSHVCKPLMSYIDVPKPPTSTSIVGFEKETKLLIDRLESGSKHLDIVSIVGMGGIGKTTLAKKLCNEKSIRHHFHKQAFCTVSQVYRKRNVLLEILKHISPIDDEIHQMSVDDLANRLRQSLLGFRYLVVVDDIWDINVWYDLRASFPDNYNGSRVIFTTRINTISESTPCPLPFLSDDESWELLHQKIFHKDPCPEHLLEVGKLIAKNCKGLPLAIVVIAGLLARKERSLLQWNEIADALSSFASSEGCNDIIKLSYDHLPEALKSCFLYLGSFPEDENIEAKQLTLLWVAEEFVLKSGSSSSHEIAKNCLNELSDRNLVTITKRNSNGGIKSFSVHDLIRDVCRTEAQEEHYMCYINAHNKILSMPNVLHQHRICIEAEWRSFVDTKPRGPTVHSLLLFSGSLSTVPVAYFEVNSLQSVMQNFKLVQVLDLQKIVIEGEFPSTITTLVHLRYLGLRFSASVRVPRDICNLWNLETLVVSADGDRGLVIIPNDIWEIKKLMHVEARRSALVVLGGVTGVFSLLPDIISFTALIVPPGEGGEELLRRLSNVRKFTCVCSGWWDPHVECYLLPKLEILTKLESLKLVHMTGVAQPPFMFSFPSTITTLTLEGFHLPWNEFSSVIGMLPCLEVLVLHVNSFSGEKWNVEDDEFPNIKYLKLKGLNIEEWNASEYSFPCLEKLVVFSCLKLIAIPPCFSEVVTLMSIDVHGCKKRVADSAIQIQNDQFDSGNESFEVSLYVLDI